MAQITRRKARKPLAVGETSNGWHSMGGRETFTIFIRDDDKPHTLELTREEALSFVLFYAAHETFVYGVVAAMGFTDRRSAADKLRALADKLETE
jgi:hypothetical protein